VPQGVSVSDRSTTGSVLGTVVIQRVSVVDCSAMGSVCSTTGSVSE
jgi:hypothetical protein